MAKPKKWKPWEALGLLKSAYHTPETEKDKPPECAVRAEDGDGPMREDDMPDMVKAHRYYYWSPED